MLPSIEVTALYNLLRKYKSHDKAIEMVTKHYYFKVCDKMSQKQFHAKVSTVINTYLKGI